jgi:predicted transcriptional regulator
VKFEDFMLAAEIARKYSKAVQDKLYIGMTTAIAHAEIDKAEKVAWLLENTAANLDTIVPDPEDPR